MTTVLKVQDAHRRFGSTAALDGLGFEMREGELLGLLGPNGAGKTTLVRALAGRVRLDRGTLELFGRRLEPDTRREGLGVVPQEIALYPLLTARENLAAFGEMHGLAGAALAERVRWALDWTALGDRAREPVRNFSGGMKRRLNIACGVLHRPRMLLLDEPTVGVDPQSRERIWEMLTVLRDAGASILVTTHHLEEAEVRCERIVIVDHGRRVAEGTVEDLVRGALGPDRTVLVRVDRAPATVPAGLVPDGDGRTLRGTLREVDRELPDLLRRVSAAGVAVADLEVRRPSLQEVFIALTGRELRE